MFTRRRTRTRGAVGTAETWAAASVLLDYPTAELVDSLDAVEELVGADPDLSGVVDHLRRTSLDALQSEYVATFDQTRKCALYLTYFAYGDTRRRGVALVQFKQAYRSAGVVWDEECGELPDHLCAVLQFGATHSADVARGLLDDHRAGVEMLRLALEGWRRDDGTVGSPWAGVLRAVCRTLPELHGDEADAVRRLVENGPPREDVGLQTYGTDPLIAPAVIPVGAPR